VIQDLTGEDEGHINGYDAPRSPDIGGLNGAAGGQPWQDQGYTTPFGNGAVADGGWNGAGASTPYGATPYGQSGPAWN
jgi:DNA-directed RNA polymerase II subunit RPB3